MGASDKRLRRAQEQVERLLARKDLPAAVNALLELPASARGDLTAFVAPALRATLASAGKNPSWGVLHTLSARVEAEPQLVDGGAGIGEANSARWPLLVACLRAKDWGRAGRILALLRPGLVAGAPALAAALAIFIDRRGEVDGADLEAAGWRPKVASPSPDPRLGYDPPARRRLAPLPPPQTAAEAERAVLTVAATQPFPSFAETVLSYLSITSLDVGRAIRETAAGLAVRELLSCLGAAAGGRGVEPLLLLARLSGRSAADEIASELQLALRVSLGLASRKQLDAGFLSAIATLAATSVRVSSIRSLLLGWLRGSGNATAARTLALAIAEALLTTSVAIGADDRRHVWAVAFERHGNASADGNEPPRVPAWLEAATAAQLKEAADLGRWLVRLDEGRREEILAYAASGLSVDLASRLMEAVWTEAGEALRGELARHLVDIIDRAQDHAIDALLANPSSSPKLVDKVWEALDGPGDEAPPLLPQSQTILRRIPGEAFRYNPDLLGLVLCELPSDQERLQLLDRYLEGRRDQIEIRLAALTALRGAGHPQKVLVTMAEIGQGIPRDFARDHAALARALVWGDRTDSPRLFRLELAQALLDQLEEHPPVLPLSQVMDLAQSLAHELLPRRRAPAGASKKPVKKTGDKKDKKAGKPSPQPHSPDLEAGAADPARTRRSAKRPPQQQLVLPWSSHEEP